VPYPKPEAGLVINYSYLWRRESDSGYVEGIKDRPCAIILTVTNSEDEQIVMALPITHTEPQDRNEGIEIPQAIKKRLGLDGQCSWIIVSEFNRFVWPGPDLRPISRKSNTQYSYGLLPPAFYNEVKLKLLKLHQDRRVTPVNRTE